MLAIQSLPCTTRDAGQSRMLCVEVYAEVDKEYVLSHKVWGWAFIQACYSDRRIIESNNGQSRGGLCYDNWSHFDRGRCVTTFGLVSFGDGCWHSDRRITESNNGQSRGGLCYDNWSHFGWGRLCYDSWDFFLRMPHSASINSRFRTSPAA